MHRIHKYFLPLTNVEGRLHLGKTQINLVFRSICTTFAPIKTNKVMDKKTNETLLKNVEQLSKLTEQEVKMMPAIEAPLPSVEQVKQIVALAKNIIFPDFFNKRQSDETIRSYYIGVHMEELYGLLVKQIAHGLQFCEDCEVTTSKAKVYAEAEKLALEFINELPEIKRLLYTDAQAMFDNDPAAPNYGEVIFC